MFLLTLQYAQAIVVPQNLPEPYQQGVIIEWRQKPEGYRRFFWMKR